MHAMKSFTVTRRVMFAETDMAGIMHFANYFRWMEEVEHEMFRSLGLSVVMHSGDVELSWPRVSTSCEFLAPLRFEEQVTLSLRIVKLGRSSLTYEVQFHCGQRHVATGKLTSVCVAIDHGQMKAIAIPADIREKLQKLA